MTSRVRLAWDLELENTDKKPKLEDMKGMRDKLFLSLTFAKESCPGGNIRVGIGSTKNAQVEHCYQRFEAILHGCQTDTRTKKIGGKLQDGCVVYSITQRKDDPVIDHQWYRDHDEMECEDAKEKRACNCWYKGAPDHHQLYKLPGNRQVCKPLSLTLAHLLTYS